MVGEPPAEPPRAACGEAVLKSFATPALSHDGASRPVLRSTYLSSCSTRPRVLSAAAMWPPRKTAAMPREPSLRASGSAEKRSESRLLSRWLASRWVKAEERSDHQRAGSLVRTNVKWFKSVVVESGSTGQGG